MSKIYNVELNKLEKKKKIITNILHMLNLRLNENIDIDKQIKSFNNLMNEESFSFMIEKEKYSIFLSMDKLSSINKSPILKSFLDDTETNKIIVISNPNKKIYKQIVEYINTEVWFDYELLVNIPNHNIVPQHIPLTKEEIKTYYDEYGDSGMSKILDTDIMARYLKLKPNDIVKIIRPTITSGYAPFYRKVVPGKIDDLLFD